MIVGHNGITIVITAPNGSTRTHTVTITHKENEACTQQSRPTPSDDAPNLGISAEKGEHAAEAEHCISKRDTSLSKNT